MAYLLDSFFAGFASSNSNRISQISYKNFAITNLPGLRGIQNGVDDRLEVCIRTDNFDFDFGNEVDCVFRSAVDFRVTFLSTVTAHFTDRHPVNALFGQRVLHIFKLEVPYDSFDFLHPPGLRNCHPLLNTRPDLSDLCLAEVSFYPLTLSSGIGIVQRNATLRRLTRFKLRLRLRSDPRFVRNARKMVLQSRNDEQPIAEPVEVDDDARAVGDSRLL